DGSPDRRAQHQAGRRRGRHPDRWPRRPAGGLRDDPRAGAGPVHPSRPVRRRRARMTTPETAAPAEHLPDPAADATLDAERQRTAQAYARVKRRLMLVDLLLGGVYLAVWLLAGWYADLRDFVVRLAPNPWLNVPLYAFLFGLPYFILDLPLSYYSGFVLPHRYGQRSETLRGWLRGLVLGLAISGVLGAIVLEVVSWPVRASPGLWWLYAGLVMLFFSVIL